MSVTKYRCPQCGGIAVHECSDSRKNRRGNQWASRCLHCEDCFWVWFSTFTGIGFAGGIGRQG